MNTLEDKIDAAITYNVNRGLIHEDRWKDLKSDLLILISQVENEARIDELNRLMGNNYYDDGDAYEQEKIYLYKQAKLRIATLQGDKK